MQEELLGAAYAVLEKVHIVDVRSVHETKDVPAKDSEGRRKNKVGKELKEKAALMATHISSGGTLSCRALKFSLRKCHSVTANTYSAWKAAKMRRCSFNRLNDS